MNQLEKMLSVFFIVGAMLGAGLLTYTWSNDPMTVGIDDRSMFSRFSSVEELSKFMESAGGYQWTALEDTARMGENTLSADGPAYSHTNVQVQGVDELDVVKTDGRFIFVAGQEGISILKAYPPEELSNVTFLSAADVSPDRQNSDYVSFNGVFVLPGKLIVVSSSYEYSARYDLMALGTMPWDVHNGPWTMVSVLDVSDITNPNLVYSAGVSGWPLAARLVGSTVYLVTQSNAIMFDNEILLPMVSVNGVEMEIPLSEIRYDPNMTDADTFTNILAVDVNDQSQSVISIVSGYGSTIYVSTDAIYFTIQKWLGDVVVFNEAVTFQTEDVARTTIYRISFDGLSMGATAKGSVKGWLMNQFSLDESGSYLRVATTTSWTNRSNSVYVLDHDLDVVGALEGLAPGESIYSSRFVGDTLYLVTFRQVDPLLVIDLSSPQSPRIAGELTLPGFSSYLHPVDDDHILGIGAENGTLKISLFDVSDQAKPTEECRWILEGYQWSSTIWDHKEVLFDHDRDLLVLPVTAQNWSNVDYTGTTLCGALVFNVSADSGIVLRGVVQFNETNYYGGIRRSLYIGDFLYTVWGTTVSVNLLSDLSQIGSLEFCDYEPYPIRVM